jgi:type III secretion inner rod protein HrpB2
MTVPTVAIAPVESVLQAAQKSVPSPAMEQLTQKFESMMKAPQADMAGAAQPSQGPNTLTEVVNKQEALMHKAFEDVETFAANADKMSMNEVAAQSMKLSRDMAMANFALQSTTAVAQGSNKSLQTLLKNQ